MRNSGTRIEEVEAALPASDEPEQAGNPPAKIAQLGDATLRHRAADGTVGSFEAEICFGSEDRAHRRLPRARSESEVELGQRTLSLEAPFRTADLLRRQGPSSR